MRSVSAGAVRVFGLALVAIVAFLAAGGAIIATASAIRSVTVVELISLATGICVVAGGIALVVRRRWWRDRRMACWAGAGLLAWTVTFWATTLRRPDPRPLAVRVAGEQQWQLGTGSRIAYVEIRASTPRNGVPVVYLHGGPGVSEMPDIVRVLAPLARTGHDIVVYDQLGSGRSGRLADPRGYTLERALADLDAIRRRLRSRQLILIGHSWGAQLAAAYVALHPARVAGVVFTSPGTLVIGRGVPPGNPVSRLTTGERLSLYAQAVRPRSLLTYALTITHPGFAHAFAGDAEMDRRFAQLFAASRPALLCDGHRASSIATDGVGHYANQLTLPERGRFDPRARLRRISVPALVLHGACDYEPAGNAPSYASALRGARLVEIPGAGHQIYVERPGEYQKIIRSFLEHRLR